MTAAEGEEHARGDSRADSVLAQAIIDTIHEPLIVLDGDLRIVSASGSFFKKFGLSQDGIYGTMFYELGNGEWNIQSLRTLLEQVIPQHAAVEDYEVSHKFASLGWRTMLVNAREIKFQGGGKKMLLTIRDITEQRAADETLARVASQKTIMLNEMRHRISNSLQLIANILLLKAAVVVSDEARLHMEDAHSRIVSIANVQRYLDPADGLSDRVEIGPYLTSLCAHLATSMIGGKKPITITVTASAGSASSDEAVSIGLVTTELVINALKYAFLKDEGAILVKYGATDTAWKLVVEDNGIGYKKERGGEGLGTSIIQSLSRQLKAELVFASGDGGTTVSFLHSGAPLSA